MTFRQFAKTFGPRILDSAARRWPGQPCTVYALGLQDPVGRMLASTLHALELAPNPFEKVPEGAREPVVAGALRTVDLRDVLKGLLQADDVFALDGEPPLLAGADRLIQALERVSGEPGIPLLVLTAGIHEVIRVEEEPDMVHGRFFGHVPIVGRA